VKDLFISFVCGAFDEIETTRGGKANCLPFTIAICFITILFTSF